VSGPLEVLLGFIDGPSVDCWEASQALAQVAALVEVAESIYSNEYVSDPDYEALGQALAPFQEAK